MSCDVDYVQDWSDRRLAALQACHKVETDSDSDCSSDSGDESLDAIHNEILHLENIIAQQQAAPPPPGPAPVRYGYPQDGAHLPTVTTSGGTGDENQLIVIKNLPPPKNPVPDMEALVIKEDVDVEYDGNGFPYVVPRKGKATILNAPEPKPTTVEIPVAPEKPCPQHGGHGHVHGHPGAVHGHVHAHGHGHARGHGHGHPVVKKVVKKRKGKTLFEKLIG